MTTDALEALIRRRRGITLPWWFAGAIMIGFILVGAAVVKLVFVVGSLQGSAATRTEQIDTLGHKVDVLTAQVDLDRRQQAYDNAVIASKDARIRQLTDTLLRAKVPVPAATYVLPSLAPTPSSGPSPRPTPTPTSSPQPRPTSTATPTPTPTPSPTPSGVCRLLPILC